MTITVSQQEFCDRVAELLTLAQNGAEVVVQEPDKPDLKLANSPPRREWVFNMHPGAMVMREDFDMPIHEDDFLKGNM